MLLPRYIIFTRHTSTITAWVFCCTERRFGSGNRYFWFAVLLRRNQPIWWGCWNLWTFCCSRVKNNIIYIYLWIWNQVFASTTIIKIMILTQMQNKIRTLFVVDHLLDIKSISSHSFWLVHLWNPCCFLSEACIHCDVSCVCFSPTMLWFPPTWRSGHCIWRVPDWSITYWSTVVYQNKNR